MHCGCAIIEAFSSRCWEYLGICANIGSLLFFAIIRDILEVHTTIESCFTIIRASDYLFISCHFRAKVCHKMRTCAIEGGYVTLKANLCCER